MSDGLAAFSGGALDGGLTYIPVCSIEAVKIAAEMPQAAEPVAEPVEGAESTPTGS